MKTINNNNKTNRFKQFIIKPSITARNSRSIKAYFSNLSEFDTRPITKEEELELFKKYKAGCEKIR